MGWTRGGGGGGEQREERERGGVEREEGGREGEEEGSGVVGQSGVVVVFCDGGRNFQALVATCSVSSCMFVCLRMFGLDPLIVNHAQICVLKTQCALFGLWLVMSIFVHDVVIQQCVRRCSKHMKMPCQTTDMSRPSPNVVPFHCLHPP